MSFVVEHAMKYSKSVAQCRQPMSQPSARRDTKTPCAYFRFLRQLAVAAVLRLHRQCQHQKWAGVVLVVVATVNYF
jgi:hypothetical protein